VKIAGLKIKQSNMGEIFQNEEFFSLQFMSLARVMNFA
jgi:hypothetical protein